MGWSGGLATHGSWWHVFSTRPPAFFTRNISRPMPGDKGVFLPVAPGRDFRQGWSAMILSKSPSVPTALSMGEV
jgi:hypothetical protein